MVRILVGFQLLDSVKYNRFFNKSDTSARRAASTYCVLNIGNSENEGGQREEQDNDNKDNNDHEDHRTNPAHDVIISA
jgi:hypothetical protein